MNQTKRLALIIATLMLLAVCFIFGASAETDTFTEGYYTYTVTDGKATIVDVDTSISGDVVIPSTLGGYPVTAIIGSSYFSRPFSYCMNVTSISVPYGVETIRNAFDSCGGLKSISLPESLLDIDDSFTQCVKLKTLTIPGSLKKVMGFRWCYSLESITFSDGVEEIDTEAFACAFNLKKVTFPESLKKIGDDAFNGCLLLRDITIPENVTYIGMGVFRECLSLEKVNILSDVVEFGEKSMAFTSGYLEGKTPEDYAKLYLDFSDTWVEMYKAYDAQDIEAYEYYKKILDAYEEEASNSLSFYDEDIVMDNVTIYAKSGSTAEAYAKESGIAFKELTDVITEGSCGENIKWSFNTETGTLTLSGSGEMYDYSYACDTPWREKGLSPYIKSAVVEEGITSLSGGTFWECYRMESVSLPNSLKDLGLAAFANCCSLKEIILPENLENLGVACFGACYGLTEITIPEKIKEIPKECFGGCFNLRTVKFPDELEIIGDTVFEGCYNLSELTIGENVTFLGKQAFRICPVLKDLYILNPNLDLSTDNYIGKWVWLVDGYDRVEFFERYAELYSELVIYIADHNSGVRDVESLEGEEKAHFESLRDEYNNLTNKIDNLQKYLGSTINDCVTSSLLTIHGYTGSTAEAYANENGIKFEEMVDIPTSGTCGNNSTWSFDTETGELVISGSGTAGLERDDNGNSIIPWESLKTDIKSLVVENGIEGIGGFENCINLKNVMLADSIIGFGDEVFRNCSSLEEIKLPQSLIMISTAAFCDCTSLKEVIIPDTVEYIYPGAFAKCFNLESVKLPLGLTCIEDDVFNYCYKLKGLEIPETVTKINGNPFIYCVSLKEISIPAGVTAIEPAAFENCWSLEDVYFYSEQTNLDNSLLGEISAYKGIEEYYGSTDKNQNITSYINVSLKYLSGDTDVQETIEGILDCIQKYEKPIYSETLTIHGYADSTAEAYATANGIKFEVITESTTVTDNNTKVEIEFDTSVFETEVELVVSEEEINANIVFGDEFENFKAYDISLEADGEKVQPNGYVTVKLPLPEGFNEETTVVYYVAPDGTKTKLNSTVENGYVIFETNHFSEYVLADESSKIEPPHEHSYTASTTKNPTCTESGIKTYTCSCNHSYTESIPALGHKDTNGDYKCDNGCGYEYEKPAPEEPADKNCSHLCHKSGFMGFIWKIINFFNKLFKSKQICACGAKHW